MDKLVPLAFPASDGREFILTVGGESIFVPAPRVRPYGYEDDIYGGHCCAYSAAMAGFGTACASCRANFG